MYSTVCLFSWLPQSYNFRAAVAKAFNISAEEIVRLQILRANNILIFTVASDEAFNQVSEFYFRTLYFPLLNLDILECFAYPQSPQYQLIRMSAFPTLDMTDALSLFGTVFHQQHLSSKGPSMLGFQTDSIGVVLAVNDQTNNLAVAAPSPRGPEDQRAVAGPSGAPAAGSYHHFGMPAHHSHSEFPHQHQGPQTSTLQTPHDRKVGRHCYRRAHRNDSSTMGQSSPAQAPVEEKRVPQGPPPSKNPKVEGQNSKASDE